MTKEEFIRDVVSRIPPAHPDTEWHFREECIRGRFLIYDGKINKCVCTHCGYQFDIAPGEYAHMHGLKDICPLCESEVICLSAGRGRASHTELHRLLTFASDGKSLWAVSHDIIVRFDDFARAQLYRSINEVFEINADEQRHWRYKHGYFSYPPFWEELKSYNVAPLPAAPYCVSKWDAHIYSEGIDEIIANSDCRYLLGEDLKKIMQWTGVVTWIALQMKYPALELLRKGGFDRLARDKLRDGYNYQGAVNIRGKSIEKALRLPKKWVTALRKAGISEDINSKELKAFQRATEKDRRFIVENFKAWADLLHAYRAEEYIRVIEEVTTLEKYFKYMTRQDKEDPILYTDYIKNAKALGWDMKRKRILFPDDLMAAHDEATELYEAQKNSLIDKQIREHAVDVDYEKNGLIIICAKSQGDLNKESQILQHCVRTYGEEVASGRTLIYFIRKAEEVKTPYYTLEIDPLTGVVVQWRGNHNCSMTPEVQDFRNGFEKLFKKMIKEGSTCQTA